MKQSIWKNLCIYMFGVHPCKRWHHCLCQRFVCYSERSVQVNCCLFAWLCMWVLFKEIFIYTSIVLLQDDVGVGIDFKSLSESCASLSLSFSHNICHTCASCFLKPLPIMEMRFSSLSFIILLWVVVAVYINWRNLLGNVR